MHRFDKQQILEAVTLHHSRRREVRFQDVDAAGIVFFARAFDYCHDAYVDLLAELGSPLAEVLQARTWAAPLRHAEADYLKPMRFGDELTIGVAVAHVAKSEITLGFQIRCGDVVNALVQSVHTFVDPSTFKRIPVPERLANALAAIAV